MKGSLPAESASEPQEIPSARFGSKRKRRFIVSLLLIAFALVCILAWRYFSRFESTDDAQVAVHLYPVSSRINGYVQRVNVGDNQYVSAGASLAEIDPRNYRVAVDQARAELRDAVASAKALAINVPITSVDSSSRLKYASSGVESAGEGVAAAQKKALSAHARVLEARAEDTKGQEDLGRYRLLLAKDEIPRQVYDHAFASAETDDAAVAEAEADEAAALQPSSKLAISWLKRERNTKRRKRTAACRIRARPRQGSVGHRTGKAGQSRAIEIEFGLHQDCFPGERRNQQEGGCGDECRAWRATVHNRSS